MSARAVPVIIPAKRAPSPVAYRLASVVGTVKSLRGVALTADSTRDPTAFRAACADDLDMIEQALERIARKIEDALP